MFLYEPEHVVELSILHYCTFRKFDKKLKTKSLFKLLRLLED